MIGNAQETGLGKTESEIKSLFYFYSFTTGYTDSGVKYLETYVSYGREDYFLDENGICDFITYIPKTQEDLNFTISLYNMDLTTIDKTHWKGVKNGKTIYYRLTTSDGVSAFSYTLFFYN